MIKWSAKEGECRGGAGGREEEDRAGGRMEWGKIEKRRIGQGGEEGANGE
ncbi:hypothetical protein [Methanothrix sp.]